MIVSFFNEVMDTENLDNIRRVHKIIGRQVVSIVVLLMVVLYLPNTSDIFKDHEPAIGYSSADVHYPDLFRWKPKLKYSIVFGLIGLIAILHMHKINEFIYYGF